ncbi:colicin E5-related ribonuclease [Paraburkholderia heleia]|uniref:colicin E5-related ribonuclease n=1 Tax=Paraburkholderia heleia TaxID=634127 RepID=UPI0009FFB5CE
MLNSGDQNNNGKAQGSVIDDKIGKQLPERGWTEQDVQNAINNGPTGTAFDKRSASKTPDGLPRNDTATVYGSKDGYVVVNDRTGEVVQISDKTDPRWIADSRIQWKSK